LSFDTVVAYERYINIYVNIYIYIYIYIHILLNVETFYRTYVTVHWLVGCNEVSGFIKEEEFLG